MRPEDPVPVDAAPIVGAAVLESRHDPERVLQVVVDAGTETVQVSLLDDGLVAFGTTFCVLRADRGRAATAVARVPMRFADLPDVAVPFFDVNIALTWASVGDGPGPQLDVAGTAYVFCPGDLRPEQFSARRRDEFNTLCFDEPSPTERQAEPAEVAAASSEPKRRARRPRPTGSRSLIEPSGMMWPPAGGRSCWRVVARVR